MNWFLSFITNAHSWIKARQVRHHELQQMGGALAKITEQKRLLDEAKAHKQIRSALRKGEHTT
jgi:hypothetical protein